MMIVFCFSFFMLKDFEHLVHGFISNSFLIRFSFFSYFFIQLPQNSLTKHIFWFKQRKEIVYVHFALQNLLVSHFSAIVLQKITEKR